MLRRIYKALAFVSLAALLAGGGLAAYLLGSGKLNALRAERIAQVLRGELDTLAAPASQPATQPASQPALRSKRSADEIRAQRREDRAQRQVIERARSDLRSMSDLVDRTMQDVITRGEQIDRQRKQWEEDRARVSNAAKDEGFEKETKYVAKLAPNLAKEHLLKTWRKKKPDAVRLFLALPESTGKRVLEQMKTAEEKDVLSELLEQIRNQGESLRDPKSGTTSGDAS